MITLAHTRSEDQIDVKTTAEIVVKEVNPKKLQIHRRSCWKGNVKNMLLDIGKIKTLGWKPKHNKS